MTNQSSQEMRELEALVRKLETNIKITFQPLAESRFGVSIGTNRASYHHSAEEAFAKVFEALGELAREVGIPTEGNGERGR